MTLVSFDGPNKLIIVNSGVTTLNAKIDLYSDWKEWVLLNDNSKYLPAFRTIGGDTIGAGLSVGAYFFLQNQDGWRIRPCEANHELTIVGNLYGENSAVPTFIPTIGGYTVLVNLERSSLTQAIQSGGGAAPTVGQIADAVWDEAAADHLIANSTGQKISTITSSDTIANTVWNSTIDLFTQDGSFGKAFKQMSGSIDMCNQINEGRWEIINNQMIYYGFDNTTELMRFDLFDQNGNPSMQNVFKRIRKH